jgi:hypothetical protein
MVPEGNEGGKVTLYYSPPSSYPAAWYPSIPPLALQPISRFIPCRLPLRTLLNRPGIDSSLIFHFDGNVYMFVFFAPARLELFLSADILSSDFRSHPKSPIYNRCHP